MNTPSHVPTRSAGFSLVELVIAIVLIGILAAMAAPRLTAFTDRNSVDATLNQLTGDIAYARSLAVRAGARVTLTVSGTDYLIEVEGEPDPVKRVEVAAEHTGLSLSPASQLVFNSRGLLLADGEQVVTAERRGQSGSLRILPTGRAYRVY